MTTAQILTGFGLIILLAVGSQVVASRLRVPALIVLLPAGFTAGALTMDVDPQKLLGTAFQPLVSLPARTVSAEPRDRPGGRGNRHRAALAAAAQAPAERGARLFLVRADGHLMAATQADTPVPQAGDTLVSLGPVPVAQATDGQLQR